MKKIKTLLVDDEFLALNLLENFIHRLSGFEIVGKSKSPLQALEILQTNTVDLLFLDIQMPTISGTNLLKMLPQPPATIFTTAYSEYAPQAFDLNAIDYLVKPFSFDRFLQATIKARKHIEQQTSVSPLISSMTTTTSDFISIKVDGIIQKVMLKNIVYIEGLREYVRIVCVDGKRWVTLSTLRHFEETLPAEQFFRIHKSYIASKSYAKALEGNMLQMTVDKIPISRSKREEILKNIFNYYGK